MSSPSRFKSCSSESDRSARLIRLRRISYLESGDGPVSSGRVPKTDRQSGYVLGIYHRPIGQVTDVRRVKIIEPLGDCEVVVDGLAEQRGGLT